MPTPRSCRAPDDAGSSSTPTSGGSSTRLTRCTQPGEIGALLRREGVYSSSLSTWRRQREAADLAALAPQKRGPKPDPAAAEARQIAQLMRENERLKSQLDKARLVIEVQKKVAALLGSPIDDTHDKS